MLNRFGHLVQEYYVDRIRQWEAERDRVKAALSTKQQALDFVADVRRHVHEAFGPQPERTPLNPRITGELKRDGYRVEKLIFESRPDFYVTANLYLPKTSERRPGVIGTCGHSDNGKAAEAYQSFAQGLARLGYVCLIYDPLGQGERSQYYLDMENEIRVGTRQHLYAGNQQFLVGEFVGAWRAWDGIRALDYLLTRPEVDPHHLGVTGNSGGGTMTTWLCGVEDRWTMAAPSCFVTTFRHNLENELPADTEQCPPRSISLGLDHDDYLAVQAGKPLVILTKERDYFDIRGGEQAYGRLKHLWELLDAGDKIELFTGPTTHGYTIENREAMYRTFNRATGLDYSDREPEIHIERDEDLYATETGQVAEMHSRPVYSYTKSRSEDLAAVRGKPRGDELRRRVLDVLNLPDRQGPPYYRILRTLSGRGYPSQGAAVYAVESEPGILVLVTMLSESNHYSRPPLGHGTATVYVAHQSSDDDLQREQLVKDLASSAAAFFAIDVRGIGETRPQTCNLDSYQSPYGCDYFYAVHGMMFDYPVVGQRVHDVLSVLDLLASRGYERIHLAGRGAGSIVAALAGVVDPRVTSVTLEHYLTSYREVAESPRYNWPLSLLLRDVLSQFDLPDVYEQLKTEKQLTLSAPWGPNDFRFETE